MLFLKWCMSICVCVCMWVNTIPSKECICLSSSLVRKLCVTVGKNLIIFVKEEFILFKIDLSKEISYDIIIFLWHYYHIHLSTTEHKWKQISKILICSCKNIKHAITIFKHKLKLFTAKTYPNFAKNHQFLRVFSPKS